MTGLTDLELRTLDTTVVLVGMLGQVVGDGPNRTADLNELAVHIHAIQQAIMSQAAARAHPDRLRLLGHSVASRARWTP